MRTSEETELMALVEARDYSFRYLRGKEPALKNITLDIQAGTVVGLVGKAGAGKTTFLKALMGILPHIEPGLRGGGPGRRRHADPRPRPQRDVATGQHRARDPGGPDLLADSQGRHRLRAGQPRLPTGGDLGPGQLRHSGGRSPRLRGPQPEQPVGRRAAESGRSRRVGHAPAAAGDGRTRVDAGPAGQRTRYGHHGAGVEERRHDHRFRVRRRHRGHRREGRPGGGAPRGTDPVRRRAGVPGRSANGRDRRGAASGVGDLRPPASGWHSGREHPNHTVRRRRGRPPASGRPQDPDSILPPEYRNGRGSARSAT